MLIESVLDVYRVTVVNYLGDVMFATRVQGKSQNQVFSKSFIKLIGFKIP